MNPITLRVIERYAHARPGRTLLYWEDVALPLFRVTVDAVVQQRKPIRPIEEFVLRAVEAGVDTIDELADFLGLERPLIEEAVRSQWHADNLDYGPTPDDPTARLRLSNAGVRVLRELRLLTPERMELTVDFDRLTWKPRRLPLAGVLKPADLKDLGYREIPAKNRNRPELADISVDELTRLFRESGLRYLSTMDILSVRFIARVERIYDPAVMLVYGSPTMDQPLEVTFAIDGRLSEEHEQAFAEIGGAARLNLRLVEPAAQSDLLLDEQLRALMVPRETVERLQERIVLLESEQAETTSQRSSVGDGTGPLEPAPDIAAEQRAEELRRLKAELAEMKVRPVSVYEHPLLLQQALTETRRRLLIISPWIRANVVTSNFVTNLERLCRRGVRIHIGYGIDDKPATAPRDRDAERALERLSRQYDNFVFRRLGNTHAKVLIWDDNWVTTSFNWLSFVGDPDRTFRQEEGVLVTIREHVDERYQWFVEMIESGAASAYD